MAGLDGSRVTDASTREQVVEFVKRVLGDDSDECAFVLDVVGKTTLIKGPALYSNSLVVLDVGTKLSSLAQPTSTSTCHIPGGRRMASTCT
jgi:hypothetical protein